jgi:hypothetical protein
LDNGWAIATTALILALVALTAMRISHFPLFVDPFYHLSITRLFDAAGGIASWDTLQFAPWGRPLLYPPLLPVLLSIPYAAGVSPTSIAQLSSAAIYPLILVVVAYVTHTMFNARTAFFSTLFASSLWMMLYKSSYLLPATLSFGLVLLSYLAIYRARWLTAAILLAAAFYTHLSLPHICVVPLIAWALSDRDVRAAIAKALVAAYVLFLPWVIHMARHADYLHVREVVGAGTLSGVMAILAVAGLYASWRRYRAGDRSSVLFPALVASLLVTFPFYSHRFFFHAAIPLSIVSAMGVDWALDRCSMRLPDRRAAVVSVMAVTLVLLSLGKVVVYEEAFVEQGEELIKERGIVVRDSAPLRLVTGALPVQSYISNEDVVAVIDGIREHTSEDDIILVDTGPLACVVTSLTGRATTYGMFKEVAPTETSSLKLPPTRAYIVRFRIEEPIEGAVVVATDTLTLVVREDDASYATRTVPSPTLPYAAAYLSLCCALAFIIYDVWRK